MSPLIVAPYESSARSAQTSELPIPRLPAPRLHQPLLSHLLFSLTRYYTADVMAALSPGRLFSAETVISGCQALQNQRREGKSSVIIVTVISATFLGLGLLTRITQALRSVSGSTGVLNTIHTKLQLLRSLYTRLGSDGRLTRASGDVRYGDTDTRLKRVRPALRGLPCPTRLRITYHSIENSLGFSSTEWARRSFLTLTNSRALLHPVMPRSLLLFFLLSRSLGIFGTYDLGPNTAIPSWATSTRTKQLRGISV
ncbi:hypothetical protein BC827DRAFT_352950 [Russula dissimulans]|nr:hypothetical protein BC827DRAFT_352950 [Russula dissimulans]